jgi:hypothetical protein
MPSAIGYASRQAAQRSASAAAARAPLHLGHTKTSAGASACPSMELLHLYWPADEPEATVADRTDWRRVIMREAFARVRKTTHDNGGLQTGSPDDSHAWKPPTTSVARHNPSRCKVAAARLDEYPSLQMTITV